MPLASLKTSYDESQRARLYNEDRKNEIQDDLMVTMRENDILKANNEELQETVVELYEDTKFLRKTLQNAYNTMEWHIIAVREAILMCQANKTQPSIRISTQRIEPPLEKYWRRYGKK